MASSPVTTRAGQAKRQARYTRTVVRTKVADAVGGETFLYSPDDKTDFSIPHPLLYTPAQQRALKKAQKGDHAETEVAKILLGDQYDAFHEAGGDDEELGLLMIAVNRDTRAALENEDEDEDDSDPTE